MIQTRGDVEELRVQPGPIPWCQSGTDRAHGCARQRLRSKHTREIELPRLQRLKSRLLRRLLPTLTARDEALEYRQTRVRIESGKTAAKSGSDDGQTR